MVCRLFPFFVSSFVLAASVLPIPAFGLGPGDRSAKKLAADRSTLSEPQVLERGDNLLGLRAGQGDAFGGTTAIGLSFERLVSPNFGFSTQVHHAQYDVKYSAGPFSGKIDYKVWTVAVQGTFHADVFGVKNLDTFLSGGLARTFYKVKGTSNLGPTMNVGAESDSTFLVAYLHLRYFVDSSWAFTTSVGTGFGTLGFGVDFLF